MNDGPTYYEVLEVAPDATAHEIRDAYARLKTAYGKDSLATYSLVSPEEVEVVLRQIEEAFQILSHAEKRRDYDRNYYQSRRAFPASPPPPPLVRPTDAGSNIVSIDRTPPMDGSIDDLGALMAPKTEVAHAELPVTPQVGRSKNGILLESLADEKEWKGQLLRQVRAAQGVSLEEMADATRVSKNYITAIEEENFAKLPASVFVRGFVVQMAKRLGLPSDRVATAYVARYRSSELCKG